MFGIIFSFLFGLIIGGFLNVVILRHNTGMSLSGRSGCFACGKKLAWFELIPVFSFLAQQGKCRGCRSKISWQYPLVELLTGLLFAAISWQFAFQPAYLVFYGLVFSLLIVITVYDLRHKIIPDSFVYWFIGLAVFEPLLTNFAATGLLNAIAFKLFSGLVIASFFAALWYFSGGRWMGFGDAKLAFGIGALLGLKQAANAVILSFWIGATVGLFLVFLSQLIKKLKLKQRFTLKSELPFAPFLVLGVILNLLFHISVFNF